MKDRILNGMMLLMVALALGISFFQGEKEEEDTAAVVMQEKPVLQATAVPHPIHQYRSQRERQRQEELSALKILWENEDTDASLRALAGEQIMEITKNAEVELAVEAALIARGQDGICIFRKGKMTIFTSGEMDPAAAALIFHLAMETAGIEMENIRLAAC